MYHEKFNQFVRNNGTGERVHPFTGETLSQFMCTLQQLINERDGVDWAERDAFYEFLDVRAGGQGSTWLEFCFNNGWSAEEVLKSFEEVKAHNALMEADDISTPLEDRGKPWESDHRPWDKDTSDEHGPVPPRSPSRSGEKNKSPFTGPKRN